MDISPTSGRTIKKLYQRRWFKITLILIFLAVVALGAVSWKTGSLFNKISLKPGFLSSILHSIPGVKDELKGEKDGRINILFLGMRGEKMEGGGLLADTIMVISLKPGEKKAAQISIPRDLYVTVPGTGDKQKINAVHFYGEQKGRGKGLEAMKTIINEVTGLPIHYAVSINFQGFQQLVDALGGVEITLDQPFNEPLQFKGLEQRCDSDTVFTIPSGNIETKKVTRRDGSVGFRKFPLCFANNASSENLECGGEFTLPSGKQTLDGKTALCYARSRVTSSDFERAKRQQLVIQAMKDKLLSSGTLTDFEKINGILNALGDNLRTDMQIWEMKRMLEVYQEKNQGDYQIFQRVLENSEEGMLYNPPENGAGYILLPIGDNYEKIHTVCQDIFNLPPQSDIKPK